MPHGTRRRALPRSLLQRKQQSALAQARQHPAVMRARRRRSVRGRARTLSPRPQTTETKSGVRQDPDRQPRRDRLPHHQHLPQLGIRTVAVHSEADRDALHVSWPTRPCASARAVGRELPGDRAHRRRPASDTGAQAVHPGYGFLAENAAFAEALEKAGIVFIGPRPAPSPAWATRSPPSGWPPKPGSTPFRARRRHQRRRPGGAIAEEIGYPVMLKASAGGGGKGMRVARMKPRNAATASRRATARRRPASATSACSSRSSSSSRATSRSRCWPTPTATSSTWASASARFSAATRR